MFLGGLIKVVHQGLNEVECCSQIFLNFKVSCTVGHRIPNRPVFERSFFRHFLCPVFERFLTKFGRHLAFTIRKMDFLSGFRFYKPNRSLFNF
jgi:hypothetical protein